jgi:hypothetical protein
MAGMFWKIRRFCVVAFYPLLPQFLNGIFHCIKWEGPTL